VQGATEDQRAQDRVLHVLEECPECGAPLKLRRPRSGGEAFVGCSAFPSCRFAEDFDMRCERMAERIAELEAEVEALAVVPLATGIIAKELRAVIAVAHPDRWPDNPLAHAVTKELTRLRALVQGDA